MFIEDFLKIIFSLPPVEDFSERIVEIVHLRVKESQVCPSFQFAWLISMWAWIVSESSVYHNQGSEKHFHYENTCQWQRRSTQTVQRLFIFPIVTENIPLFWLMLRSHSRSGCSIPMPFFFFAWSFILLTTPDCNEASVWTTPQWLGCIEEECWRSLKAAHSLRK